MIRWGFWLIAVAFAIWLALALLTAGSSGGEPTPTGSDPEPTIPPPATVPAEERVAGLERKLAASQAARRRERRKFRRQLVGVHRTMLHQPTVAEAIDLACATYGNCGTLWRKARCESRFDRYAYNASGASGLFQFLPSTWRTTPYGRFSIWSPYAEAMAAGWMHQHGRGGEWSCR